MAVNVTETRYMEGEGLGQIWSSVGGQGKFLSRDLEDEQEVAWGGRESLAGRGNGMHKDPVMRNLEEGWRGCME